MDASVRIFCFSASLLAVGCARTYRAQGMVVGVDRARESVTVSHRAIPGHMPAMVMPLRAARGRELDGLEVGARIEFRLRGATARRIRVIGSTTEGVTGASALQIPTPPEKIRVGDVMPDFTLTSHQGTALRLSEFRGRVVAVNFIYTRCPLVEVCPRLSAGFARIQRRFQSRMGSDLALLSATLDPRHDTPAVLAQYAGIWRAGAGWFFLTGQIGDVAVVASRFGVVYWPEDGLLTHTSITGVIGRDGRVAALVEGSSYEPSELGDLIAKVLDEP